MKTLVIYHNADYDGIFCREIARKFLPDAEFVGWNFGDPKIKINAVGDSKTYVLDLSPDCIEPMCLGGREMENLVWIDHHKTSIEKWPSTITGYRIDGVAACRLAWQWFYNELHAGNAGDIGLLPDKQDFITRDVSEPMAVRLAGEYDIWDKRDPMADTLQYGLRVLEPNQDVWDTILTIGDVGDQNTNAILADGSTAQMYARNVDASICNHMTWIMEWEGLKFLCVNHARFNSLLFAAKDIPETGHDALLGFRFDGKSWMVSMYHANHRKDLDLSEIAKKHGGGGHRGACGFTTIGLPPFLKH